MKIFQTDPDETRQDFEEIRETLEILETMLREIRSTIGHRRTMLKNADKKLQEFQDTIYAMLMEEKYPRKKYIVAENTEDEPPPF
jgi:hypothetical protein